MYRQEAVENSSTRLFGKIVISSKLSTSLLTYGTLLVIAVIALYLMLATYSRKQIVTGYVLPDKGALKVYAPYLGTVEKKLFIEGDYVEEGDAILQVSTGKYYAGGNALNEQLIKEVENQIDTLLERALNQEELYVSEEEQLRQQRINLSDELSKITEQIKTQRELVEVSKQEWNNWLV